VRFETSSHRLSSSAVLHASGSQASAVMPRVRRQQRESARKRSSTAWISPVHLPSSNTSRLEALARSAGGLDLATTGLSGRGGIGVLTPPSARVAARAQGDGTADAYGSPGDQGRSDPAREWACVSDIGGEAAGRPRSVSPAALSRAQPAIAVDGDESACRGMAMNAPSCSWLPIIHQHSGGARRNLIPPGLRFSFDSSLLVGVNRVGCKGFPTLGRGANRQPPWRRERRPSSSSARLRGR